MTKVFREASNIGISLIMPYYKGENHLNPWLETFTKTLQHTKGTVAYELIMVIDSPEFTNVGWVEDTIASVLSPYMSNWKILVNPQNVGVARSRNRGLQTAQYSHVLFLDQDDRLMPDYWRAVSSHLKHYDLILSNGFLRYYYSKAKTLIYYIPPKLNLLTLIRDDHLRTPGQIVVRRRLLLPIGFPVPRRYAGADDRYLWLRLFRDYPNIRTLYLNQAHLEVNVDQYNFSHNIAVMYRSCLDYWEDFGNETFAPEHASSIRNDITRLKGQFAKALGQKRTFKQTWLFWRYKLTINKIIRYLVKMWVLRSFRPEHPTTNAIHPPRSVH